MKNSNRVQKKILELKWQRHIHLMFKFFSKKKRKEKVFDRSNKLLNKHCNNFPSQQLSLGSFDYTLHIRAYIHFLSSFHLFFPSALWNFSLLRGIRFRNGLSGIQNKLNNMKAAMNCSEPEREQQVKWFIYCFHLWLIFFFLA